MRQPKPPVAGLGPVVAPVLTPFTVAGDPDAGRFVAHARWLLADGCTGLAPFGTTSEANSLGLNERKVLLVALLAAGIDAERLLPGTGLCNIPDTVELTRQAVDVGCAGVLMLPPFYYKIVSDEGLYRYFATVIEQVGSTRLRLYLYHIPPVAQVGFSQSLIARLQRDFPEVVVGLKDSSGDWAHTKALIESFPGMKFYSGSEAAFLDNLRAGGAGSITAGANINAALLSRIAGVYGREEAVAMQATVGAVRKAVQAQPMIPILKAIVAQTRSDPLWSRVRPPLESIPAEIARPFIAKLARECGFRMDMHTPVT